MMYVTVSMLLWWQSYYIVSLRLLRGENNKIFIRFASLRLFSRSP